MFRQIDKYLDIQLQVDKQIQIDHIYIVIDRKIQIEGLINRYVVYRTMDEKMDEKMGGQMVEQMGG